MSILSNVKTYAKLVWENLPSKKTPVDAKNLNRMEEGIAWNNEAIKEIADAVMSEIVNDPNKIASLAAVYSVKQDITKATQALGNKITNPATAAVGQVLAVKSVDANGKPTEYETVKNEASPADWSVNDENVPGYIANRTHWEELIQEQGTLLEETTIEFTTNLASISGIGTSNVKDGGEYIVYWNGNVYECTAFTDSQSIILGNGALFSTGEDTGEPFGMEMLAGTSALIMKSTKDVETVTLKIEAKEVVVCHKLDKKYLPDDIGGGVSSWDDLTDKPFYPIYTTDDYLIENMGRNELILTEDGSFISTRKINTPIYEMEMYKVIYNDVSYILRSKSVNMENFGRCVVLGEEDGTTPFLMVIFPKSIADTLGTSIMLYALDGAESVTLEILNKGIDAFQRLPQQYINDKIVIRYDGETITSDFMPDKIISILKNNPEADVFVYITDSVYRPFNIRCGDRYVYLYILDINSANELYKYIIYISLDANGIEISVT